MSGRGRPIRFLGAVMGGWVSVRAALLWPHVHSVPEAIRAVLPPIPIARTEAAPAAPAIATVGVDRKADPARFVATMVPPLVAGAGRGGDPDAARLALAYASLVRFGPADYRPEDDTGTTLPGATLPVPPAAPDQATTPAATPAPPGVSRWSGSAWAIARPGGRATPFASQLGGSQAGARVAYAIDDARRLAVYARASAALDTRQQEAAVGLDWRPADVPVRLIAERRIGVAGIDGGTAVGAVGGIGPVPVGAGVSIEGYAQGGVIVRDGASGFADGAVRVTRRVAPRIDLGVGAWGAAQKGAHRIDTGPTVGIGVPVAGRTVRLAADWRQRVAGEARPGSGPAISLGVDF